jgi:integrase
MYENNTSVAQSMPQAITAGIRPWLDNYKKPSWMVNESLHDNEWTIKDDSQRKPVKVNWESPLYDPVTETTTLLTGPKNDDLLELAQTYCIELRESQTYNIDSALVQKNRTGVLMNILAWMRLNLVDSVEQLDRLHFERFLKDAPWGYVKLLRIEDRLAHYVASLKKTGQGFPMDGASNIIPTEVYRQMGVNPHQCSSWGKRFHHRLWTAVKEMHGEKMVPNDKNRRYRDLIAEPEPEPLTIGHNPIREQIYAWQGLHDLGYRLPQQLTFSPLRDEATNSRENAEKIARRAIEAAGIEYDEGMTETIPDLQAFHLIDAGLRWVIDYGDELLDIRDAAEQTIRNAIADFEGTHSGRKQRIKTAFESFMHGYKPRCLKEGAPGVPWPLNPSAMRYSSLSVKDGLAIGEAIEKHLMVACAIVIAAFSARRQLEIENVRCGDPTEDDSAPKALFYDFEGEPWLWCWIEKTLQRWDRVPIPRVVVKALEILERASAPARAKTGTRFFFQYIHIQSEEVLEFDFINALKAFADFVGVPPMEDGNYWVFKPHQFRRFFALLYMYRYDYGSHGKFEALSYHLRHLNMEMTKRYVEEIREGDMLKAMREQHVVDLMSDSLTKKRIFHGGGGDAMNEQLDAMLKEVVKGSEVLPENTPIHVARQIAERVMKRLGIEMVPFVWGYCYAFKDIEDGVFHGNCIKKDAVAARPNLALATPKSCYNCKHLCVDDSFKAFWEHMADQYQQIVDGGRLSESLQSISIDNLKVFREGLKNHFGCS